MKQTICTPTSRWSVEPSTLGGHAFVDVILKHASGAVLGVTLSAAEAALIAQALDLAAEECAHQPASYLPGAGDNDTNGLPPVDFGLKPPPYPPTQSACEPPWFCEFGPAGVSAPEKVEAAVRDGMTRWRLYLHGRLVGQSNDLDKLS